MFSTVNILFSVSRSPVKQTSLFQYFQPTPQKKPRRDSESASKDTEDWIGEDGGDDDLLWVEEENPDAPWPPPCKKPKT